MPDHHKASPVPQQQVSTWTAVGTWRFQFSPTLWPTCAAALAVLLTLHLGNWQRGRAEEKRSLQNILDQRMAEPVSRLDAGRRINEDDLFRRLKIRGEFAPQSQIFVDNKAYGVQTGYHVFARFESAASGQQLIVNRGFVPRAPDYPTPPVVSLPVGTIEIEGVLVRANARFLELGSAPPISGNVWQNLTVERYQSFTGLTVAPLVLNAATAEAPLVPVFEKPDARVSKHIEYMLTWYSLAATVLLLWFFLNLHRKVSPTQ
jgi:surfeit locus 1 family protein